MLKERFYSLVMLAFVVSFSVISCNKNDVSAGAPALAAENQPVDINNYLPLSKEPATLRMWIEIEQAKIGVHTSNLANLLCFQEIEKMTNVTVEFIHPPAGMATEQINLMMASADLPDMTFWNWRNVPGGATQAINDNIILPLNDYIAKLPFYSKILKEDLVLEKDAKTDDGYYYDFPRVYRSEKLKNIHGFMIRKDWLDKLGLPMPETVDEYYNTLVAFRDRDPNGNGEKDEVPMVSMYAKGTEANGQDGIRTFYAAWGKWDGMYINNGKVYFGAYENEYKDYLLTMRKWIAEGLIDPNFPTLDLVQFDAARFNNISGLFRDGLALGLDKCYANFKSEDIVIGAPFPVLTRGAQSYNFQETGRAFDGAGTALSPKGKNNDLAAKWLDYCYSEEAGLVLNFGKEGITYNWVDGFPLLVDDILKNPTMSVNVALGRYAIGVSSFSFINDARVREQRQLHLQVQQDASQLWSNADISRVFPLVSFNAAESQEQANIMSEINTFVKEYTLGFLLGRRDINREFDGYINTLKSMNIERAIQINQAAFDRYNTR